ncbi:hypothetical protein D3C71_1150440 [compost metagenome]
MQPGEGDGAHYRARQRLDAAEQHHDEAIDRAAHMQRLGRDAAFGEREQRTTQARKQPCDHESRPLHALDVNADRIGPEHGIPPGPQRITKRREQHPAQQQHTAHHQGQREVVVVALV